LTARRGSLGFREILQVITPVTKRAAEREWQVNLVEQFIAGHQRVKDMPGVAELDTLLDAGCWMLDFTARAEGAEREEWIGRDKGIACLGRIK